MKEFTSSDTKKIKGIAIILMLIHHLWTFPERLVGGELNHLFNFFGDSSIFIIGSFGQICVSIFFFLGGYGIYMQSKKRNFNILNNLKKIYIAYWKVLLIFIPITLLFFIKHTPYCITTELFTRFDYWTWKEIIKNFLGVSTTLNGEWWFIKSYVIAIILFPFIKAIINKNTLMKNIFYIVIISILMSNLLPAIGSISYLGNLNNNYLYNTFFCQISPYIACFYMGVLFAKENLLIKLYNKITEVIDINIFTDIIIIGTIIFLRNYVTGPDMDIIYVPLFIICSINILNYSKRLDKLFKKFGEHSTNMWLTHSFYCYYFYPIVKIVVGLKWAIPCLIILIALSLITSYIINFIWKNISIIYNKCIDLYNNRTSKT